MTTSMWSCGGRTSIVAGVLAGLLLAGCGGDDPVETPPGLLSADQVGGTAVEPTDEALGSAGPDTSDLFGPGTKGMGVYERDVSGSQEEVVLRVRQLSPPSVRFGFEAIEDCLSTDRGCRSLPLEFERERVEGLPDGSLGFASQYRDESGEVERSYLRSYSYVEDSDGFGQLVLVSLLREDGSDPEVADLVELTEAQVAKTEAG